MYESTYRIEKLLNELNEYMPERFVVVCRELTKKFEESWRGLPKELLSDFPQKISKGEFVIIISPKTGRMNFAKKNKVIPNRNLSKKTLHSF